MSEGRDSQQMNFDLGVKVDNSILQVSELNGYILEYESAHL